jgi:CheY-like chemotaxis protein
VKTALEALAKHHIDLAIIDLYMPEKDGLELIELIRVGKAKGCVSGLPIILHSAALTSCKAADELLAKFCPKPHFLSKPINAQDLLHWVKELLVRH